MKRPKIIVGVVTFVSLSILALAYFVRPLLGMVLYDTHSVEAESVNRALTREQQHFLGFSFDWISGGYSEILAFTNVIWIATALYLLRRLTALPPSSSMPSILPNQSTDPTLASGTPPAGQESSHP
jgi:hypothetical protein